MDFRPDFPYPELDRLRARARNAMMLLDLENCDVGYSPTRWQRSLFPREFQRKIRTSSSTASTPSIWRPLRGVPRAGRRPRHPRRHAHRHLRHPRHGDDARLRHLHEVGQAALPAPPGRDVRRRRRGPRLLRRRRGVHGRRRFKEWVLAQDDYDLSRFVFTGLVPIGTLVRAVRLSDLHIYLTVPFVLSWSLLDALACGCTVLASDTPPVREMIEDGKNGLLVDFFDIDALADLAVEVLRDPAAYRPLGQVWSRDIQKKYSLEVTLPRLVRLFNRSLSGDSEREIPKGKIIGVRSSFQGHLREMMN